MVVTLIAFVIAAAMGWLILGSRTFHESITGDTITNGPQKIHTAPVPRIGGLTIFVGFVVGTGFSAWRGYVSYPIAALVVVCGLPAFLGGFYEDITKRGGILMRLAATFLSAGLGFWFLDGRLDRLDVPFLDQFLRLAPLSLLFTMFAAGGVSQSLNLIDGLNGLAAFVGMVILSAIGFVAWRIGDPLVLSICLSAAGGILGFFLWNFPRGKIFCGDGGAYFIGFIIAEVSVLLVHRHHEVSAWFPLMAAAYPIWETVFSMFRRRMAGRSTTQPDALHLHSLVYRWAGLLFDGYAIGKSGWRRNSLSSAVCWIFPVLAAVIAVCFWNNSTSLYVGAFVFAVLYILAYRPLVSGRFWRRYKRSIERRKAQGDNASLVDVA